MKPFAALAFVGAGILFTLPLELLSSDAAAAEAAIPAAKMNAYVGCINRLSERSYASRKRYFSWAAPSGHDRRIANATRCR